MRESVDIQRREKIRRLALRLVLLSLYVMVAAPLFHSIGHENDHVHTPDGGIIFKAMPSDIDDGDFAAQLPDDPGHGHQHGSHTHDHDHHDHDGGGPEPEHPTPLDHADSFAHFSASITTPPPTAVVPPPVEAAPTEPCIESRAEECPRTPSLTAASPRGPPIS